MILVIVEAETSSASSSFNFEILWHLPTGRVSLLTLKIEAKEEIFPLTHPFRISRGSRTEAARRKTGIPIPAKLWEELEAVAKTEGVRMLERLPATADMRA